MARITAPIRRGMNAMMVPTNSPSGPPTSPRSTALKAAISAITMTTQNAICPPMRSDDKFGLSLTAPSSLSSSRVRLSPARTAPSTILATT